MFQIDNLYLESGYLDFKKIVEGIKSPFLFIIGGRGTGKTYGAINYLIDTGIPAIFMRRTQEEADTALNNEKLSTALQVFNDRNLMIHINKLSRKNAQTCYKVNEDSEPVPVFISCSLSGAATIRGFSAEDIKLIIYDEFIKEPHKAKIKGEGKALFNAYETINRNRELAGKDPVKLICMSNSDDIFNPVFKDFGILDQIYLNLKKGKQIMELKNGLITVISLSNSPISQMKKKTVLYQVATEEYQNMAIGNNFETPDHIIKSLKLKGMRPVVNYGSGCIYRYDGGYYLSSLKAANISYTPDKKGKRALLGSFPVFKYAYDHDLITCENLDLVYLLEDLFS